MNEPRSRYDRAALGADNLGDLGVGQEGAGEEGARRLRAAKMATGRTAVESNRNAKRTRKKCR